MRPTRLRLAVAAAVATAVLVSATTLTFAAGIPAHHTTRSAAPTAPRQLVVPDVRGKAYVFAEGILDDAGFAWRVDGATKGYAANTVVTQTPSAGARLVDTGAPLVTLVLTRNTRYAESGEPVDAAPFRATAVRFVGTKAHSTATHATAPAPAPASPKPRRQSKPTAPVRHEAAPKERSKPAASARPPAFVRPGAPKEPLDEIPLPDRATRLRTWLSHHPQPTTKNVRHWLFQHEWIVTGAKFGWWRGDDALRILIGVDRDAQRLWHMGARSEAVASAALREVQAQSRSR